MAKKRDHHRATPDSTRCRNRLQTSPPPSAADSTAINDRRRIAIFVFIFIVSSAISVLLYRNSRSSSLSPLSSPLHQRGLVRADVDHRDILNECTSVLENDTCRNFGNPVLAYITPWNSRGYDNAKRFGSKFTHLSPVWYDMKSQGAELVLEGRHNADLGWIAEVRERGDAQVLPRVVLEALPKDLLTKKKQRQKAIDLIIAECRDMGYDGIVLESWSRWAAYGLLHDAKMRKTALQFIEQLGYALHNVSSGRNSNRHLQLVYVIGPPSSDKLQEHDFGPEDLQTLSKAVDGFSLMTYDFSSPYSPGPNAPLKWIRSTLQVLLGIDKKSLAHEIFVGINFYGYDFVIGEGGNGQAIISHDYLSLLKQYKPTIRWERESAEHYFLYSDDWHLQHAVFYPSLMSVSARLEEARSWGAGISIWEIGQGLDYFFDLLLHSKSVSALNWSTQAWALYCLDQFVMHQLVSLPWHPSDSLHSDTSATTHPHMPCVMHQMYSQGSQLYLSASHSQPEFPLYEAKPLSHLTSIKT